MKLSRTARFRLLGLLAMLVSVTAVAAAGVTDVAQKGRAFATRQLEIVRGSKIRFNNEDGFTHQIYIESPTFNFESDEQDPGTSVDVAFPKAGLFAVRCHIHPKMLLQVDVH